ncbi:MAG: hypothetical protein R3324_03535 [Halobacteriales archaeon]|nr:hypothetical protein [Halobacteriales archaeon]
MPYVATKKVKVAGTQYQRGDLVDTSALSMSKVATLNRVGLLIQSDQAASAGVERTADDPGPAPAEAAAPAEETAEVEIEHLGGPWYQVGAEKVRGKEAAETLAASLADDSDEED